MVSDAALKHVMMDAPDESDGAPFLFDWMAAEDATPLDVDTGPNDPYNIIYSAAPLGHQGIVHSRQMRWYQMAVGKWAGSAGSGDTARPRCTQHHAGYLATGYGGTAVVMPFDCARWLELAQQHRASHTILVPVQYQR